MGHVRQRAKVFWFFFSRKNCFLAFVSLPSMSETRLEADYVIVGAGSAGCVLANRLTADGKSTVLLLEAGGDDRPMHNLRQFVTNVMIQIPVGYAATRYNRKVNWLYDTEPDASGRHHQWPRGKVLGGSSAINGLLYIRGQHADYDLWRQLGCIGWSWDDVKPYFIRSEDQARGADEFHGVGGPLHVSDLTETHVLSDTVLDACVQAGLPRCDPNGADQEGASYYQLTVKNGRRCTAATAYLHPIGRRRNLRIETYALASRVLLEARRATGVEFEQNGEMRVAKARAEVILAGGVINSPQLLQLSGIGPAETLRQHGVDVVLEAPAIGENLQDHYMISTQYRLQPGVISVNEMSRGLRMARELIKYAVSRRGLLTMSAAHVAAFCKSRAGLSGPDIQFHILPASVDVPASKRTGKIVLEQQPGLTIAPCQLRPESRGSVHIKSPDFRQHPTIVPNYLADPLDQQVAVESLRWARKIAAQPALAPYIHRELMPGSAAQSDEALLGFAQMAGSSIYHPVGTCRMGSDDGAVVDPSLRVRGIDRLRVVDASVMPRLVSGNTNAPTIMIAEKAADMILSAR